MPWNPPAEPGHGPGTRARGGPLCPGLRPGVARGGVPPRSLPGLALQGPVAAGGGIARALGQGMANLLFPPPHPPPMGQDEALRSILRGTAGVLHTEDLLIEAVKDIVREEVKEHIREALSANPDLKEEVREAVKELLEAKVKEAVALLKVAKATAKVGMEMVPPDLREEVTREMVQAFERQINAILERT